MKTDELRRLPTEDLVAQKDDRREELFNLRFRSVTEPVDDPHRVGGLKREIARINTVLRQREIETGTGRPRRLKKKKDGKR